MKKLFHYTVLPHAKEIVESKKIKRATAGVPKTEKPVCWLSTNTFHEVSAFPKSSLQELIDLGYVRFTVTNAKQLKISNWHKITRKANMSPGTKSALEQNSNGKHLEWYGTLQEIPIDLIQNIEYMDESKNWVSISEEELLNLEAKEEIITIDLNSIDNYQLTEEQKANILSQLQSLVDLENGYLSA